MDKNKKPVTIMCSAIWVDDGINHPRQQIDSGVIFCGRRHHNIFEQIIPAFGWPPEKDGKRLYKAQGFITSEGHFANHIVARQLAIAAGQIEDSKAIHKYHLFSEDLW